MRLVPYVSTRFPFASVPRRLLDIDPVFRAFELSGPGASVARTRYDLEATDEEGYRLTLNATGLGEEEIEIEVLDGVLKVRGESEDGRHAVRHAFRLGEHVEVEGARLEKGLLTLELKREVPEALKPRRIEVEATPAKKLAGKAKKQIGGAKKAA